MDNHVATIFTPPSGITSNYGPNPPQSLALLSQILFPILNVITLTFVGIRFFYAFKTSRGLTFDSVLILLAVSCVTAQAIVVLTETRFARHSWDVSMDWLDANYYKKVVFAQSFLSTCAILSAKVSILTLYRVLFGINTFMRRAIYAGIGWALLTYAPFLVVTPYLCAPHSGEQWGNQISTRCDKLVNWDIASGAMAVLLDIYILILPLTTLRTTMMSFRRKCAVAAVFATASCALICATISLVFRIRYKQSSDTFYNNWRLIITAFVLYLLSTYLVYVFVSNGLTIPRVVESFVIIIVACLASFRGFVKQYIFRQRPLPPRSPSRRHRRRSRNLGRLSLESNVDKWGKDSEEIEMYSTSHLSGWRASKDGLVQTEIGNALSMPEEALVRDPKGISKTVVFEQKFSRGTVDGPDEDFD